MRFVARLLLGIALLLAQHVALAHQVWHLAKGDSQPAQSQLCEHHAALATVGGALDSAPAGTQQYAGGDFLNDFPAHAGVAAPALAPSSRGPPGTAPTLN